MEPITRNKIWSVVLMVLVIANLSTLGVFWYLKVKDKPNQAEQDNSGSTFQFLVSQTGMNDKQQVAYLKLIRAHQQAVRQDRDQLRIAKDNLFNMLSDNSLSQARVDSIAGVIGKFEKEIDIQTFNHFRQVRALCNPDQQLKFDNIIKQIMRMMSPAQPGMRRGPMQGGGPNGDFRRPPPDGQGPPDGHGPPPQ